MPIEDEGLPPEVQAEVDAIKRQEGLEPATTEDGKYTEETEAVAAPAPAPPKGRRAQQEAERNNLIKAAEERAAKAEAAVAEVRREAAERHARLEGLIEAGNQQRQQQPVYIQQAPQQQAPPKDWQTEHRTAMRDAQKALAASDYDGYHENLARANEIQAEALVSKRMQELEQRFPQQQQQVPQKPIWLTAVENQFNDVLAHQRGPATVAAFMQMEGIGPQNFNAENMQKAFTRARKELNTSNGTPAPTEQQRQVHAGGPVNGSARVANPQNGSTKVNVPKNWRQIARAAGMTEADYLRRAKEMV